MKTLPMKFITGILLIVFAGVMFTSCRKKPDAPVIPPNETFAMNMNALPDSGSGKTAADTTMINWIHSAANVWIWQTVVTIYMAVPVLAYAEAFNHQPPTWDKKTKKYKWEYSVTGPLGVTYTAKLYGWTNENNYEWQMYISQVGGFQNFLWYEGVTAKDQSRADWTLYKSAASPVKFIGIVYIRNTDGTSNIKYTNIEAGAAGNGGYIYYGITTDTQYNAFYDINVIEKNNLTEIRWNTSSKTGKVRDPLKFGNTDWHCWDAMLKDAVCN